MNHETEARAANSFARFMGLSDAEVGDEREQAIMARAASFGFTVGIYVNLVVALIAAVLGGLALPTLLLLATAIPSWPPLTTPRGMRSTSRRSRHVAIHLRTREHSSSSSADSCWWSWPWPGRFSPEPGS